MLGWAKSLTRKGVHPVVELSHTVCAKGVTVAKDGMVALECHAGRKFDVILMDMQMPVMDGITSANHIRRREMETNAPRTPISAMTANAREEDREECIEAGMDDYISKPFKSEVLVARCRAVLRRSEGRFQSKEPEVGYRDHYLMIDLVGRVARANGENVDLSPMEWKVLAHLVSNRGQLLTYQQILENVWGLTAPGHLDYVHVYVSRLRSKLEPESHDPRYLHTAETIGYRFEPSGGLDSSAYVGNAAKPKK